MIHFAVTENGSTSIKRYLSGEGQALADRVRIVLYSELARMERLPLGTWLFAEKDRLDPAFLELATLAAERLDPEVARGRARVLNDPRHVRLRLDLLRAAHEMGVNPHRVVSATEIRFRDGTRADGRDGAPRAFRANALRFPVFVRQANDHRGSLTPLLETPRDLVNAMAWLLVLGIPRQELAVAEFCDTQDAFGVYRKISAYKVGDRILPRTVECSSEWMVKWRSRLLDREHADEELRYCETNPHEAWIRAMFELARIDYGRIDYTLVGGAFRLWEINTHPWIGGGPTGNPSPKLAAYRRLVAPARDAFFASLCDAWAGIDLSASDGASVPLNVPDTLRRALVRSEKHQRNAQRWTTMFDTLEGQRGGYRLTRAVRSAAKRTVTPIVAAWLRTDPR